MKRIHRSVKGFTLVELLVVIAIIGILAGIILVSLSNSRSKAQDVKIISDVKQIRTQLEADYDGVQYVDLTNTGGLFGGFDPNSTGTSTLNNLLGDAFAQGGAIKVVTSPLSGPVVGYAVYGQLVSSSTLYFCLDSIGGSNQQATSNTGTTCPQ